MSHACDIPCLRFRETSLDHWAGSWVSEELELLQLPLLQQSQMSASPSTGDQLSNKTKGLISSARGKVCHCVIEEVDVNSLPGAYTH